MLMLKHSLRSDDYKELIGPKTLSSKIYRMAKETPPGGWPGHFHEWDNVQEAFRQISKEAYEALPDYPLGRYSGRGVVISGGGPKYFPSVYVNARMLRLHGCVLPIHVYYLGAGEMDPKMRLLLENIPDVKCFDAFDFAKEFPIRILAGWEAKVYSILTCPFEEVLLLDADNTPLTDPTFIFDDERFCRTGTVLWPDYACWRHDEHIWRILGMESRNELQVESGQVLVNKDKAWPGLLMAKNYCDYSDYFFRHFYGDKEAFHFGWRYAGCEYESPPSPGWVNASIILQHWLDGSWLFAHRAQAKFRYDKGHKIAHGFPYELDTLDLLDELREQWHGGVWENRTPSESEEKEMLRIGNKLYKYRRLGIDSRDMELRGDGTIKLGGERMERRWYVWHAPEADKQGSTLLSIIGDEGPTALLRESADGVWRGKWLQHERCETELAPYE